MGLIYNNVVFDAFFIKSEMLSIGADGKSATIGATFRYVVTALNDGKRVQVAS